MTTGDERLHVSTPTRTAGGLDLPASGGFTAKGGKRQGRELSRSLKTTR